MLNPSEQNSERWLLPSLFSFALYYYVIFTMFEFCIIKLVVNYDGSSLTIDTDLALMFVVLMIWTLLLLIQEHNQVSELYLSSSFKKLSIVKVPTAMVKAWKEAFLHLRIWSLVDTTSIQVVLLYLSKFFLPAWAVIWKGNFFSSKVYLFPWPASVFPSLWYII